MKVCVLQPDYTASEVDYRLYDPPRDLSPLLSGHDVHHEFLDKRTTYRQLQALAGQGFDIFVNLCEGYLDWDIPSIDVIHALDRLGLPYTGPSAALYDPPKPLMKYVAYVAGVATPRFTVIDNDDDVVTLTTCGPTALQYPLFVKPAHSGDSRGIAETSRVESAAALINEVARLRHEFPAVLVEEYIDGREFTVLVARSATGDVQAFQPVEYVFTDGLSFKTYALKTSALHPDANRPVSDADLSDRLKDAAEQIFRAFNGVGYARLDFRGDARGTLYFLEINFTCSLFYPPALYGSADHILNADGMGAAGFLQLIIHEGIARFLQRQPRIAVRPHSVAGYGTYALVEFMEGDVVFPGEEQPMRLVTTSHVHARWNARQQQEFRQYAYPISDTVFGTWSDSASDWRPQNHSCDPNTAYRGLDVIALRAIAPGEELLLDYGRTLNEQSEPFDCHCGSQRCRGRIAGMSGNSVTARSANPLP